MCGSESSKVYEEEMNKKEKEREDAISDEEGERSSQQAKSEYWRTFENESIRNAWAEAEKRLDSKRSETMACDAIEKIDQFESTAMQDISKRHAEFDAHLTQEIDVLKHSLTQETDEIAKKRLKLEIERKLATKEALDKWRAYAHSTVEKFYARYRGDLASGLHKPLWRRQKLWAWVGGSVFACSALAVSIASLIYTKQKDSNAQRQQAELDLIARQNNLDKSTVQALTASITDTKDLLIKKALSKYLPWLRDAITSFKLGKASLTDLAYFFGITFPTDDDGSPISEKGMTSIVNHLVDQYDKAEKPSYASLIEALTAMGTSGYSDSGASLSLKPETITAWSAMQFNWILVAALDELMSRFSSGLSKLPAQ